MRNLETAVTAMAPRGRRSTRPRRSGLALATSVVLALMPTTGEAVCASPQFSSPTGTANFAVGYGLRSVAVGDFNADGEQDLVGANAVSDNVSILLGTGTGSFGAATNFAAGSQPYSVAVGDFNADGDQDLAVAN